MEYGVLELKVPCLLAFRLVYTSYEREVIADESSKTVLQIIAYGRAQEASAQDGHIAVYILQADGGHTDSIRNQVSDMGRI